MGKERRPEKYEQRKNTGTKTQEKRERKTNVYRTRQMTENIGKERTHEKTPERREHRKHIGRKRTQNNYRKRENAEQI